MRRELSRCFSNTATLLLLLDVIIVKYVDFILLAREYQGDERGTGTNSSVGRETHEQGSDFGFGPDVALALALLRHLESHLHAPNEISSLLLADRIPQLRVLPLSLLVVVQPLRDVEGIGTEEPVDLLFEFGDFFFFEGVLKDFGAENEHGLVEVPVVLLV